MFSAFAKTLGQMNDPRIRGVIGKTLALAILGYILFVVLIYLLIGWLAGLSGWLEGLAQFGGALGAMVVAWFIFPGIAAAIAGIFADEVIDAVEAKHYPNLGPARRLSVWSVVVDGLQLAGIAMKGGREELGRSLYQPAIAAMGSNNRLERSARWHYGWDLHRAGDDKGALEQWAQIAHNGPTRGGCVPVDRRR